MKQDIVMVLAVLALGVITIPTGESLLAKSDPAGITMGTKGYVGTRPEDLHKHGIHLSGMSVYANSTQTMDGASFSVSTTNISKIRLTVTNPADESVLTSSTWYKDSQNTCDASFSIDASLLTRARLHFDYSTNSSKDSALDGCFFELNLYTNWGTAIIELN